MVIVNIVIGGIGMVKRMNDLISLEEVNKWADKLINEIELIFSDIREKKVDDSVCGLCEYDCDHGLDGFANECPGFEKDDCFKLKDNIKEEWTKIKNVPTVPAIPISVIEQIKAEIKQNSYPIVYGVNNHEQGMTVYGIMQVIDHHIKEYME